jgi:hypothetical protein
MLRWLESSRGGRTTIATAGVVSSIWHHNTLQQTCGDRWECQMIIADDSADSWKE